MAALGWTRTEYSQRSTVINFDKNLGQLYDLREVDRTKVIASTLRF